VSEARAAPARAENPSNASPIERPRREAARVLKGAASVAGEGEGALSPSALLEVEADAALMKRSSPAPIGTFVFRTGLFQEDGPPALLTREGSVRLIKATGFVNDGS
jgi:hypothetical protein